MIRIDKQSEPSILRNNKVTWTNELMGYIRRDEEVPASLKNRYNHDEVKTTLKNECYYKCMYCESTVSHVAYEHIEHIRPKAKNKFPELTYEWTNLGLACPICNHNKGDRYDIDTPFINPYEDNPEDHFIALGAFIYHKSGDKRAYLTEIEIGLNRPELIQQRAERVNIIRNLFDLYTYETNSTIKESIRREIEIEIGRDKPYSFCTRSIYQALLEAN